MSEQDEHWERVKELFCDALEAPPEEREAVLIRGASGDPSLLADARELLHASLEIEAQESTEHALPFRWGSLEVRARIGSGSFGEVFRAFDPVLQREVALKLHHPELRRGFLRDARADLELGAALEEARRLARIRHPNVLPVLGVEIHEGDIGIWTDLVQGETLEQVLVRTGGFSAEALTRVGSDLCRALAAVHDAGIVHGDVKTSNAMQDRDGRVILMDLGAGRSSFPVSGDDGEPSPDPTAAAPTEGRREPGDATASIAGHDFTLREPGDATASIAGHDFTPRGTPAAMAPELLDGTVPSVATDLYALGTLLYRLATTRYPFQGGSLDELRSALLTRRFVPLEEIRPDLPAAFARLVHRSLSLAPTERPGSAREFGWLLTASLGQAPADSGEPGFPDVAGPTTAGLPRPATRFIGRARELSHLRALLSSPGLVTVVGTGGVGKTRIAQQLAEELARALPSGASWIDLVGVGNRALVRSAIGRALGFPDEPDRDWLDLLVRHVGEGARLLVVDNAEHLREEIRAIVSAVVTRCPRLHVLVTSRRRLDLAEERVFRLAPMALPPGAMGPAPSSTAVATGGSEPGDGLESDAVRLFLDRARRSSGDFIPTKANLDIIVEIVRRLDGVPLALELAAARVGRLGLADLATRLASNLGLLAPPGAPVEGGQHRTVLGSIAWSYDLLAPEEATLFRRLAVFSDGWSLAAAEAVCSDAPSGGIGNRELGDVLAALVEQSLVHLNERPGLPARYRFLEAVRSFAVTALADSGEGPRLRAAHLDWVEGYVKFHTARIHGESGADHLQALDHEYSNILAAFGWMNVGAEPRSAAAGTDASQHHDERAAEACTWLGPYWYYRGFFREGLAVTLAAHARLEASPAQVRCACQASTFASRLGEIARAENLAAAAVETARKLGDEEVLAPALGAHFPLLMHRGLLDQAKERLDEVIEIRRRKPLDAHLVAVLGNAAVLANRQGDMAASRAYYVEAISHARRREDEFSLGPLLGNLAYTDRLLGDLDSCSALAHESLGILRRTNNRGSLWIPLLELAWVAILRRHDAAAREHLLEGLGITHRAGQHGPFLQCVHAMAELAWMEERPEESVRLLGFVAAEAQANGYEFPEISRSRLDARREEARAALGEASYVAAWVEGRGLDKDRILARLQARP